MHWHWPQRAALVPAQSDLPLVPQGVRALSQPFGTGASPQKRWQPDAAAQLGAAAGAPALQEVGGVAGWEMSSIVTDALEIASPAGQRPSHSASAPRAILPIQCRWVMEPLPATWACKEYAPSDRGISIRKWVVSVQP